MTEIVGLLDLLGLDDPESIDPEVNWRPRRWPDRLRVPIGRTAYGAVVELDLKEAAEGGMGPHGVIGGASASGKTELIRTLLTTLAITHAPADVGFAGIEARGGDTFHGLARLPHAFVTMGDIAAEWPGSPRLDRFVTTLTAEIARRQELLRSEGHRSHTAYTKAVRAGAPLMPLPHLLIVIDELSLIKDSSPGLVPLLRRVARLGRALGLHLLIADQTVADWIDDFDRHLSYRVVLRTFTQSDSTRLLGIPSAWNELPREPGNGFLKRDSDPVTRFRAAYLPLLDRVVDQLAGWPGVEKELWEPLRDSTTGI
ncbi:FtsK/SpoIIIE domain-containing protein [Actinoplanes sp. NBRC 101535]|uniref:FtsK/SpoIIIE domain-containing protein n=1 Tax=Actinoplanes sp. NBRC 101535 TaxID=3032196 RepID=UPI00249FDE25|nr:FtsK/SpoIIIE domain-containing protein [Actinoplanes sp. NBRC 101535]GLY02544.1 hypothetical protein Acsp01_29230 [Actinoplanes sp. NBRC 101535]